MSILTRIVTLTPQQVPLAPRTSAAIRAELLAVGKVLRQPCPKGRQFIYAAALRRVRAALDALPSDANLSASGSLHGVLRQLQGDLMRVARRAGPETTLTQGAQALGDVVRALLHSSAANADAFTWPKIDDDLAHQVLSHLDPADCLRMAVTCRRNRDLIDTLPSRQAALRLLPTRADAAAMLSEANLRPVNSRGLKAPASPSDRVAERPLRLVEAGFLAWPALRRVLQSARGSVDEASTLFSWALHFHAVEQCATRMLGARFLPDGTLPRLRALQMARSPFVGPQWFRHVCAVTSFSSGLYCVPLAFNPQYNALSHFLLMTIFWMGGTHLYSLMKLGDLRPEAWLVEAHEARALGSVTHAEMYLKFDVASRELRAKLSGLHHMLAEAKSRSMFQPTLDNPAPDGRQHAGASEPYCPPDVHMSAAKYHEVCDRLVDIEEFATTRLLPFFAWLRHFRAACSTNFDAQEDNLIAELHLARAWKNEDHHRLDYIVDALAALRPMPCTDAVQAAYGPGALGERLRFACAAWAKVVATFRIEIGQLSVA